MKDTIVRFAVGKVQWAAVLAVSLVVQTYPARSEPQFFVPKPELVFVPVSPYVSFESGPHSRLDGARLFSVKGGVSYYGVSELAAVTLSLTVSGASANGTLVAYPPGAKPVSNAAAIAYGPGLTKTVQLTVGVVGAAIFLKSTGGSVDVKGYVTGYFLPQIAGTIKDRKNYASTRRVGDSLGNKIGVGRRCYPLAPIVTTADPNTFATVGYGYNQARVLVGRWRYVPDGGFEAATNDDYQLAYHC